MKIGIDISQIIYGTGVSSYTKNLVSALLALDKENQYCLFGGSLRRKRELKEFVQKFQDQTNVQNRLVSISPMVADFLWNNLHKLPIEFFTGKLDVFHSSDWAQPPARQARLVTTIHDLVPLLFPESSSPKIVATHQRCLKWVQKEVDRVITVSEATKNDIITHLRISAEKISVVYEAPDPSFKRVGEQAIQKTKEKYKIPKEYLLVVGADPRKNVERIAQAIELMNDAPTLVVVGRKWESSHLNSNKILWLGYIEAEDLAALYGGAGALVYASLYEGFGLPILAAMQAGCPVVTSNISSMPEVAGKAAVLVNPQEVDNIKQGIEEALNNREELIKKGFERVKDFSWEKAARETIKVYKEAYNQ